MKIGSSIRPRRLSPKTPGINHAIERMVIIRFKKDGQHGCFKDPRFQDLPTPSMRHPGNDFAQCRLIQEGIQLDWKSLGSNPSRRAEGKRRSGLVKGGVGAGKRGLSGRHVGAFCQGLLQAYFFDVIIFRCDVSKVSVLISGRICVWLHFRGNLVLVAIAINDVIVIVTLLFLGSWSHVVVWCGVVWCGFVVLVRWGLMGSDGV